MPQAKEDLELCYATITFSRNQFPVGKKNKPTFWSSTSYNDTRKGLNILSYIVENHKNPIL